MPECEECGKEFNTTKSLKGHWYSVHPDSQWTSDKICHNKDKLKEYYVERGWTLAEIAEEDGVSRGTVSNNMDKFDMDRRQGGNERGPWWDKELLEHLYIDKRQSAREISERWDCAPITIQKTLNKLDIPTRDGWDYDKGNQNACYTDGGEGYKVWIGKNPDDRPREKVTVHQVLACVYHDPHEVFAEKNHVHHGSNEHEELPGVERKWANWRENVQVMTDSEHMSHHRTKEYQD